MAADPEHELVARLRRGEPEAFDQAYERYRARVFSFLARLTRDRALAEELSQETWLRLARHATRLQEDTELGAWLFTVARNLHVSHCRWRLLDGERLLALAMTRLPGVEEETPFDLASAGETERRLEAALGALQPRYREVILLIAVERFEPAQAARILGLTPEAVRQRLSRARAMLASALEAAETRPTRAPGRRKG